MIRMLLIPVEGDCRVVEVQGWQEMATAIGARLIERVRVGEHESLAVDESGLYARYPQGNPRASLLYGAHRHGQWIVGPALFGLEAMDDEGGVDWVDADPDELFARAQSLLQAREAEARA